MEKTVKLAEGFHFDGRIYVPKGIIITVNDVVINPKARSGKSFIISDAPYKYHYLIGEKLDIKFIERGNSIVKEFENSEYIKKSSLKLWDVFINNNGHLSIVYAITKNSFYIYNYNGSNYSINKDNTSLTNYKRSNVSPEEFFADYPSHIRKEYKKEPEYQAIKSRYLAGGILFDFSNFDDSNINTDTDSIITIYKPSKLLLLL